MQLISRDCIANMNELLMTPGPAPLPPQVIEALGRQVVHHRTKEYGEIFKSLNEGLSYVFRTRYPVLTFTASGTGGMEAAIVNCFSPGDKVLLVSCGVFGDRFADIVSSMGLSMQKMDVPWGKSVDLRELDKKLEKDIKGVIVTHNETSTGVFNDIEAIGKLLEGRDTLFIVDAVSSLGGMEVNPDEWGIDIIVTSSQKALMSPPGLTFVSVSPRALEAARKNNNARRHYWDFVKAVDFIEKEFPQNPFTPAVNLIAASKEALSLIRAEGMDKVLKRHFRMAAMMREGAKAMGLELFADESCASNTVTAIKVPEGAEAKDIIDTLRKRHRIIISGGNKSLKGRIIRIAHMGYISEQDVLKAIAALEDTLTTLGVKVSKGVGYDRAKQILEQGRQYS